MHQITVGADPEVLLQDVRTGSFFPACGLFGGTKAAPKEEGGVFFHEDNVALELGWSPSTDAGAAIAKVQRAVQTAESLVGTFAPDYVTLSPAPCALYTGLERYDGAQEFGCDPDFNAYRDGAMNRRYKPGMFITDEGDWRFAGGHIHIGYNLDAGVPQHVAAMLCDLYLTLPILGQDRQGMRRKYYGSAGRFRPKEYGLEYRTLSSAWFFDRAIANVVFNNAFALGRLLDSKLRVSEILTEVPWNTVRKAIRHEDANAANVILTHVQGNVPHFEVGRLT